MILPQSYVAIPCAGGFFRDTFVVIPTYLFGFARSRPKEVWQLFELSDIITIYECLPDFAGDELVAAQNNTFEDTSILQPFVSKMNNCWTPVENMGKGIRNGSITHDNSAEQTEEMNDAMNSDGIS